MTRDNLILAENISAKHFAHQVLWMDGNKYTYVVDDIKTGFDPKDRTAFEQPTDNESEYLTLQTCTNGDPNSRTYIRAKRIA